MNYIESLDLSNVTADFTIFNWQPHQGIRWMQLYWYRSVQIACVYVAVIFSMRYAMRNKKPYDLRLGLVLWNAMLTAFSFMGTAGMAREMFNIVSKGEYKAVCFATDDYQAQYWIWLFGLSKVVELGDTAFIILRKQRLLTLHWTHHALTLIFTWYAISLNISLGPWFVSMNYFVHTFMYAYYVARAMRVQITKPLQASLTALQIVQLAIGFYVSYYALQVKMSGNYCECTTSAALFGSLLYLILLYMFSQFFIKSYLPYKSFGSVMKLVSSKYSNTQKVNDYVKAG